MKVPQIEALARQLMDLHGLQNWSIQWSNSTRVAGQTNYVLWMPIPKWSFGRLTFSARLMTRYPEWQVRDVILHEIAHALVTPRATVHGYRWSKMHARIGGTADVLVRKYEVPPPRAQANMRRVRARQMP